MAAARVKCGFRGCSAWAFERKLCRQHIKSHPQLADTLAIDWTPYLSAQPAMIGLVVAIPSQDVTHADFAPGTRVSVVCMCEDQTTAVCRAVDSDVVGYFPYYNLKTEQQVFEEYQQAAAQEAERRKQEEKLAAEQTAREYEAKMKDMAVQRAEQEARMRAQAAEQARLQAVQERQMAVERERLAAAELAAKEAEYRTWLLQQEQQKAKQAAEMVEEARRLRAESEQAEEARRVQKQQEHEAWLESEKQRKDREYLDSLPAWQRDLVLKKRSTVCT
eukprot:m.487818 g.487818  ORF g.487818 m.487818 type:complete len:276 (-) comp25272_c0_seq1:112-939(-)